MSVSTRSWACKGRRKKSIYQCGHVKSACAELTSALSHCLHLNHTTLGCSTREQPSEPPTGWASDLVRGANLTRLHVRRFGFNATLAQNRHTQVCSVCPCYPIRNVMLEAALHTAGGKKMDFFLVEDTRLAQPEWDSFPHSQQPPNTSQRHPRNRLLALMTASGGEVWCCLCSVWQTPTLQKSWACQDVFPGGHWLLCGNTALLSLQLQAQLGEIWPTSLCSACLLLRPNTALQHFQEPWLDFCSTCMYHLPWCNLICRSGSSCHTDVQHATIITTTYTRSNPAFHSDSDLNSNSSHARGSDSKNFPREAGTCRLDILVQLHLRYAGEKVDMVETQCKNV